MPREWTAKDERKYDAIKSSASRGGASKKRAAEIAARTVNRDRREEGRTSTRRTSGTGNPNRRYEDRTRQELYNVAKERNVAGRSGMTKAQLISALRK